MPFFRPLHHHALPKSLISAIARKISGTKAKNSAVTDSPILVEEYPRFSARIRFTTAKTEIAREIAHKPATPQSNRNPSKLREISAPTEGRLASSAATETASGFFSADRSKEIIRP